MNSQMEKKANHSAFFFFYFFSKKIQKMIDNDFNHVYTENVNKGPVPYELIFGSYFIFLIDVGPVP